MEARVRAGVLGIPGRCSHEKGTEEDRSGEGRNRWNGEGEGGKKGKGEADGEEKEALELDGRRRRRRRGVAAAEAGVAGAGRVEEVGMLCCVWCRLAAARLGSRGFIGGRISGWCEPTATDNFGRELWASGIF